MGRWTGGGSAAAIVAAAVAAHAAITNDIGNAVEASPNVVVIGAEPASLLPVLVDPAACNAALCTPAQSPAFDPARCNVANDALLRDLAYFATDWSHLEKKPGAAPLPLGGGWTNARVLRDDDGTFFADVVERVVDDGVTEVVVAFTGANTADDFASAPAFIAGEDTPQLRRAVALYQSVIDDPRYAAATVRVTGFSLGAGLTQFLLGYTLSRYGEAFTDRRTTFAAFGVPGWAAGAAHRFGLDPTMFAGRFTDYTPVNDVVRLLGDTHMGSRYALAPYTPVGAAPGVPANDVVAHTPYPYMAAFGLPDWLGERRAAVKAAVEQDQALPTDPDYGTPGRVALRIDGDAGANTLVASERDDVLAGGGGADLLCGGDGDDRFAYFVANDSDPARPDLIAGFGDGRDRLDFSAIAAAARIDTLAFVGAAPFTGIGQVRAYRDGADTVVAANLVGDASPELLIRLAGAPTINAERLVLSRQQ